MIIIELFRVFGSFFLKDEASKPMDEAEKKGSNLGKTFGKVAKGAAVLGGAALAVGGAMYAMGVKVGDNADRLLDLKSITGMSTDEIQRWEKVTKIAGVSADAMTNASQKLTKSLDTMINSGGKGAESLEALGLSIDDVANMNADERMNAITEALAGVEDTTLRAKLGTDLLGGSWSDIAPIVDMGAEAMQNAKDSANIISEEDLNKANDFRIRVAELKDQFGFFFTMLSIKILPILNAFMDWIGQYMPQIQAISATVFEVISDAVSIFIGWIGNLIDWLKQWYDDNQETIEGIKEAFQSFVDAVTSLIEGFIVLFKRIWEKYGDDILKFISNIWGVIRSVFKGAFDLIVDIFNVFAALFKGDWTALWESVKTLASNLWDNIKGIITNAIDLIIDTFKSINLFEIGKNIIQGLINGLSNMLGKVKEKAQEIASAVGDKVKGFFGIRSPSRLMMEYGEHIGDGLAIGIKDSKHEVAQATESMATGSTDAMEVDSTSGGLQRAVQYITNIVVEGNIDSDLYEDIMRRQKNDYDINLALSGVR